MVDNRCSIDIESASLSFKIYGDPNLSSKKSFIGRILRRQFSKSTEFCLFREFSLRVQGGERVGILGRNGSGKTTLLKLIAGVYPPTTGRIRVVGKIAPIIGFGSSIQPQLTGSENIVLMGTMMGITAGEMKKRMQGILSFADLSDYANMPVKYYSSGMRHRLAFSIVTELDPDILLSDEVFAGGDAEFRIKAEKRVQHFIDRSYIFLFVSHNMNLLKAITHRTIWIEKGKIIADGPSKDVCDEYEKSILKKE